MKKKIKIVMVVIIIFITIIIKMMILKLKYGVSIKGKTHVFLPLFHRETLVTSHLISSDKGKNLLL